MKNTMKFLGIAFLVIAMAFTLAGCGDDKPDPGPGDNNPPPGALGDLSSTPKTYSGVFKGDGSAENGNFTFTKYSQGSSETFNLPSGSAVTANNGTVSIKLGIPTNLFDATEFAGLNFTSGLKIEMIYAFVASDDKMLHYTNIFPPGSKPGGVCLTYATKDGTVTGNTTMGGSTTGSFNLNLKQGWNTVIVTSTSVNEPYHLNYTSGVPGSSYKWYVFSN